MKEGLSLTLMSRSETCKSLQNCDEASVMWLHTRLRSSACAVQIQTAGIFLVGCPACNQNFKHFFCTLTCSPDQSLFTNVTSVQNASDNNRTAVEAIDVFVADAYGRSFYDSCKV